MTGPAYWRFQGTPCWYWWSYIDARPAEGTIVSSPFGFIAAASEGVEPT